MSTTTGIEVRHLEKCPKRKNPAASRCTCQRRYRGVVWDRRSKRNRRGEWTRSKREAMAWRAKAQTELASGKPLTASSVTLTEEMEAFLAGAEAGTIHHRNGKPYKPATLRGYRRGWNRIKADLGAHKLGDIRRADVQLLVDRLAGEGLKPSTIQNTLDPLRVLYRRAIHRALSVVMGHASIGITFDRYGHLMPGGETEVGELLSEYLAAGK